MYCVLNEFQIFSWRKKRSEWNQWREMFNRYCCHWQILPAVFTMIYEFFSGQRMPFQIYLICFISILFMSRILIKFLLIFVRWNLIFELWFCHRCCEFISKIIFIVCVTRKFATILIRESPKLQLYLVQQKLNLLCENLEKSSKF